MKKLINEPRNYVDESLAGLVAAHQTSYQRIGETQRVISRRHRKKAGKVGLASGGGFGHLPLFAGYVGEGLLDACAVGDVFAGPSLVSVREALNEANRGAGIVAIIGNYGGDRMVFAMATEALEAEGLDMRTIVAADDVASASVDEREKRRGVAGIVFAFKVAGAAAEVGLPLAHVASVAQRSVENCRTIGVALSPCTIPTRGEPTFTLAPDAIELGMGIHGEQGVWRGPHRKADVLVDEMLDRILAENVVPAGGRVAVLCNSLGATPIEELFILFRRLSERLSTLGIKVVQSKTGHFATSMEMAGASVSILALDDELEQLLRAPAHCPFWTLQ